MKILSKIKGMLIGTMALGLIFTIELKIYMQLKK